MRCSEWATLNGVDPIGTAGSFEGILMVEWPLPWPRDVAEIEELREIREMAQARQIRMQLVAPTSDSVWRTAVYFQKRSDTGFNGFLRAERQCRPDDLVASLRAVLCEVEPVEDEEGAVDLLVCSHGSRDRCCGSQGTKLAVELQRVLGRNDRVRVWRTSHLGGHRFAPTMLVLPRGSMWGYLDLDACLRIVSTEGEAFKDMGRYRGNIGLSGPEAQVLEREAIRHLGWKAAKTPRLVTSVGPDRWRLEFSGTLEGSSIEATVSARRVLPVPTCGEVPGPETKCETEWQSSDIDVGLGTEVLAPKGAKALPASD